MSPLKRITMSLRHEGPAAKEDFEKNLCAILSDRAGITVTVVEGFPHNTHEARTLYWVSLQLTNALSS